MGEYTKKSHLILAIGIFIGFPLLIWALGDFPRRNALKESFSILFILAFSLMIGLFFLTRINSSAVETFRMRKILKFHKFIAYTCVVVFLAHPFLLVVPRYFESGVDPMDAFTTIITTFDSQGIILGIIAWCLMLILGITSFMRKWLPMKYTIWRFFHGILAMIFVVVAAWHMLNLGRHANLSMSIYIIIIAACSELLLLRAYILKPAKAEKVS